MRIVIMIEALKEDCDYGHISHKMPYFLVFVRIAIMVALLTKCPIF